MKKMLAIGAAAAALALAPVGIANGATSPKSSNSVSIDYYADYDFTGTNIDVGLRVRCYGGSGTVDVLLEQAPPETPAPVGVGSGPQIVTCDGRTHAVGTTVVGAYFDVGKAKATATLIAPSGTTKAWRQVYIRVV